MKIFKDIEKELNFDETVEVTIEIKHQQH